MIKKPTSHGLGCGGKCQIALQIPKGLLSISGLISPRPANAHPANTRPGWHREAQGLYTLGHNALGVGPLQNESWCQK